MFLSAAFVRLARPSPCVFRAFSSSSLRAAPVDLAFEVTPSPDNSTQRPMVLLHGLYGNKNNWRALSKAFASKLNVPVYSVDLRNHGTSPHVAATDYMSMADDVVHLCQEENLSQISLVGHSMGGKVAMSVALRPDLPPSLLRKLIIEDVSPKISSRLSSEFVGYAAAMRKLAEAKPVSRREADTLLKDAAPDLSVRQFLMTNLITDGDGTPLRWRFPPHMIEDATLEKIGKFPFTEGDGVRYEPETLFVRGARSQYLADVRVDLARTFFPNLKLETLDTGHWGALVAKALSLMS
ncbi:alpha/beta-hydrolase [Auriculariales sp. MPI-PUGE-AT-0066]|nr:alpha/beta-hydrolase [Auriculariales sp. MPI-PUGE-AT-0066]